MPKIKTEIKNPFLEIYQSAKCRKPYDFPLVDFPLFMDIELTNACNLDCLMCPRQLMSRKVGFMSRAIFGRIIAEAAAYKTGIRFIRFGEPLMHKEIFSFIKTTKEHGLISHITTNGLLLDEAVAEKILASGLDSIIFSFQGWNKEEYEKMRNNRSYDLLKANIYNLKAARGKAGLSKPFIQVTTTFLDEPEREKKRFVNEWRGVADKVDYWHTSLLLLSAVKRVKPLILRQRVKEVVGKGRCTEVLTKLSVNWNGDVTACCSDYNGELIVGNVTKNTLKEIWYSEKLNKIRDTLSRRRRQDIPFCVPCTTKFVER